MSGSAKLRALRDRKDREKAWERLWLQISCELARGTAAVALDMSIEGALDRPYPPLDRYGRETTWAQVEEHRQMTRNVRYMLKLALADYRFKFPKARGGNLWVYKGPVRGGGAVYCRFCGDQLLYRCKVGKDYSTSNEVLKHTRECALGSLAGIRKAEPPKPAKPLIHVIKIGFRDVFGHDADERCNPGDLDFCYRRSNHRINNLDAIANNIVPGLLYEHNPKTGTATEVEVPRGT